MATIHTQVERSRGCGYRKQGGYYLVGGGTDFPCDALPISLHTCPCCGHFFDQTRGFQWVSTMIFNRVQCASKTSYCANCPIHRYKLREKMGLMWIGKKFYPSPEYFMQEARKQGISKRIAIHAFPKEFQIGEDWLMFAHPQVVESVNENGERAKGPGIFYVFQPERLEYVVTGKEPLSQLEEMEAQGIKLIEVIPLENHQKNLQKSLLDE